MSRLTLAGLHPQVRAAAEWALGVADYYKVPVEVTSGYRSWAEQTRLRRNYEQCVATGRFPSGPDCLYPANRPGDSAHNWGLAFDSTVADWLQPWWTAVREAAGFRVLSNDVIHAEVPGWRSVVSRWPGPPR